MIRAFYSFLDRFDSTAYPAFAVLFAVVVFCLWARKQKWAKR